MMPLPVLLALFAGRVVSQETCVADGAVSAQYEARAPSLLQLDHGSESTSKGHGLDALKSKKEATAMVKTRSSSYTWTATGTPYHVCTGTCPACKSELKHTVENFAECAAEAEAADTTSFLYSATSNDGYDNLPLCAVGVECADEDDSNTTKPWTLYSRDGVTTGCCVWNADGETCGSCGVNNGNWCHLSSDNCGHCGGSYYSAGATPDCS